MHGPESIQLLDYLRAIRQRWRLVALVVAVTTGVALIVSLSSDKQYDATAELLLRDQEPVNALLNANSSGNNNDPERELNTEVELIKVASSAHAVRRQLGLRRPADALLSQIETDTSSTSNIVSLRARDRDPVMAARIANAFATQYVRFRLNSARQRYLEAAELAQRQLLALAPADRRTAEGIQLQARQRELEIAGALQTGGAEIVRRASVPGSAARPRPKLSAALGLFLGLILGMGAALVLNLVDRRLKDEHEVEEFFGVPVLATIPRPARRGIDALEDPAQREAYGLLSANLRMASARQASSVVMITSPSPGEGKTSVTIGLARALARLGLRVIAIEADLRRPAFSRYADVSRTRGLAGVIEGTTLARGLLWLDAATLEPVESEHGEGAISLLPAGTVPPNPQRVLSDPGVGHLIEVARTMADIVLVDTAPVGTVNDAAILAPQVDGVLLVARLNKTTKDAGRRARRTLSNLGVEVLGVVVTDVGGSERRVYYSAASSDTVPVADDAVPESARTGVQGGVD